jgi:hypothetical protein
MRSRHHGEDKHQLLGRNTGTPRVQFVHKRRQNAISLLCQEWRKARIGWLNATDCDNINGNLLRRRKRQELRFQSSTESFEARADLPEAIFLSSNYRSSVPEHSHAKSRDDVFGEYGSSRLTNLPTVPFFSQVAAHSEAKSL